MAKKKKEADFGNVCGNVPKICKRFKAIWRNKHLLPLFGYTATLSPSGNTVQLGYQSLAVAAYFSMLSLHCSISHLGVLVAPQMPTVCTSAVNHDMSISSELSI